MTCDAVSYKFRPEADFEQEIRCTEVATVEVPLSDGNLHPRCKQHIPMMLRGLARPLAPSTTPDSLHITNDGQVPDA